MNSWITRYSRRTGLASRRCTAFGRGTIRFCVASDEACALQANGITLHIEVMWEMQ